MEPGFDHDTDTGNTGKVMNGSRQRWGNCLWTENHKHKSPWSDPRAFQAFDTSRCNWISHDETSDQEKHAMLKNPIERTTSFHQ
jgi:hypothetical protein